MQSVVGYLMFLGLATIVVPCLIIESAGWIIFPLLFRVSRRLVRRTRAQRVQALTIHLGYWITPIVVFFALLRMDFVFWLAPVSSTALTMLWITQWFMSKIEAVDGVSCAWVGAADHRAFGRFASSEDDGDEAGRMPEFAHDQSMLNSTCDRGFETNPATGLPMATGIGGWDVGGHLWGQSSSTFDGSDSFASSFDDGFSSSSMNDDF